MSGAARRVPWGICAITALAAALRFSELGEVTSNQFYDAAVRSMSMSWHNFFFGAFDPGGLLAIDKPPFDLWLQVVSVKLFGWGRFSLGLPEALGGTLAAPLLYDAVRRVLGRPAGLAAAMALAVLPESVLTSRSDTMDSVMMLLVIAAFWLTIRAGASRRRTTLVLAGCMLGLAFNVKLLEALIAAPALAALYALSVEGDRRRKLFDLLAASGALIAVGLSWSVLVSLAPGKHPWPVGSSDGSVWNAMFVFNGFGRSSIGVAATRPGGPGPLRLLLSNAWHYDELFGCTMFAALALGVAALLQTTFRRGMRVRLPRRIGLGGERRPQKAFAIALVVWIVSGLIVFDTMGTVHARYLEALAPAFAAVVGCGAASLAGLTGARESRGHPALAWSVVALLAISAYTFHFKPPSLAWAAVALILSVAGAALLARLGGAMGDGARWLMAGLIVAGAMLFPVHESLSLIGSNSDDSRGLATHSPQNILALSRYLAPRTAGLRYELAVDDPTTVAPLIVRDQRKILPLTSFGGRPLIRLSELQAAIRAGRVRYGLVSNYNCYAFSGQRPAACTPVAAWIRRYGINVTAAAGLTGRPRLYLLRPGATG